MTCQNVTPQAGTEPLFTSGLNELILPRTYFAKWKEKEVDLTSSDLNLESDAFQGSLLQKGAGW